MNRKLPSLPLLSYALLTAALPVLINMLLIYVLLGSHWLAYVPHTNSDSLAYWRYAYTFTHVGFDGGYYNSNEYVAAADWARFGAHGPALPIFYGALARLVGWHSAHIQMVNAVLLLLAVVVFVFLSGVKGRLLLLLAALLSTFYLLMPWLHLAMQEIVHLSFALVFAGVLYRLLCGERFAPWQMFLILLLLTAACFVRITWCFLWLPLLLLSWRRITMRSVLAALALTVAITLVMVLLLQQTTPPFNNYILMVLQYALLNPAEGLPLLIARILESVREIRQHSPIVILQTMWLLVMMMATMLLLALRRRLSAVYPQPSVPLLALVAYLLFTILGSSLLLHASEHIHRMAGPAYLICLLVLLALRYVRFIIGVIVFQVLLLPLVLPGISAVRQDFNPDIVRIEAFAAFIAPHIAYDPDAPSPWCNTILVDPKVYDSILTVLPPGIGVSFPHLYGLMTGRIKSHYVLLSDRRLAELEETLAVPPVLQRLGVWETDFVLYRNQAVVCD